MRESARQEYKCIEDYLKLKINDFSVTTIVCKFLWSARFFTNMVTAEA